MTGATSTSAGSTVQLIGTLPRFESAHLSVRSPSSSWRLSPSLMKMAMYILFSSGGGGDWDGGIEARGVPPRTVRFVEKSAANVGDPYELAVCTPGPSFGHQPTYGLIGSKSARNWSSIAPCAASDGSSH